MNVNRHSQSQQQYPAAHFGAPSPYDYQSSLSYANQSQQQNHQQYTPSYPPAAPGSLTQQLQQATQNGQRFFPNLPQGGPPGLLPLPSASQQVAPPQQRRQQKRTPQPRKRQQTSATVQQNNNVSPPPPTPGSGPGAPRPEPSSPPEDGDEAEGTAVNGMNLNGRGENDEEDDGSDAEHGDNGNYDPIYHLPPPPEAIYPNEEELEKAIHAFTLEHGYEMVRRASKRNARGVLYKRYFHCSKHGAAGGRHKGADRQGISRRANRKSMRTDCQMSLAAIAVDPANPGGDWQIKHRKIEHNHPPVETIKLAGHRRRARTGAIEKSVDGLFAIGTKTADILKFLQRSHPDGLFKRTDVANMKLKFKKYGTCATDLENGPPDTRTPKAHRPGLPSACESCRTRKRRCDSVRPVCGHCVEHGFECTYDHDISQTRPPLGSQPLGEPLDTISEVDNMLSMQLHPDATHEDASSTAGPSTQPAPRLASNLAHITPVNFQSHVEKVFSTLQAYRQSQLNPTRLTLQDSFVELLAQVTAGDGASYQSLPYLNDPNDWPAYREAFTTAALREHVWDILIGSKREPYPVHANQPLEQYNEYIKQSAIYNRRNNLLLGALRGSLGPSMSEHLLSQMPTVDLTHARDVWSALEDICSPRSDTTLRRFRELINTTLQTCGGGRNFELFSTTLEHRWRTFNKAARHGFSGHAAIATNSLSTSRDGFGIGSGGNVNRFGLGGSGDGGQMSNALLCLLFLENLGPDLRNIAESVSQKNNVAGYGSGTDVMGYRELVGLVKAAAESEGFTFVDNRR